MSRTGRSHAPAALGVPAGLALAWALCESASTWLVLAALVPAEMHNMAVGLCTRKTVVQRNPMPM